MTPGRTTRPIGVRSQDAPPWKKVAAHPAWAPYRTLLERLPAAHFPRPQELQRLLAPGTATRSGHPLRFVAAERLPGAEGEGAYEREIAASGRVSTRSGSLHDLCNALVWARFPRLKASLNQRHLDALPESRPGRRGAVRDALTLFDECGMVLTCADRAPLDAIAAHDWQGVFGRAGEGWASGLGAWVVGHANLEKLFSPYKAMTAHCLLLHTSARTPGAEELDRALARLCSDTGALISPRTLCPLPFLGIPGWFDGAQDAAFYADEVVFRPPRPGRGVPPVFSVGAVSRRNGRKEVASSP